MAFRSSGFLAYRAKIIGISADQEDEANLQDFFQSLIDYKDNFRFLIYLFSTQMLVGEIYCIPQT